MEFAWRVCDGRSDDGLLYEKNLSENWEDKLVGGRKRLIVRGGIWRSFGEGAGAVCKVEVVHSNITKELLTSPLHKLFKYQGRSHGARAN